MKQIFICIVCLSLAACNSQETEQQQTIPKGAAAQQKSQQEYTEKLKQRYEKANAASKPANSGTK